MELGKKVLKYKSDNNLTDEQCAKKLKLSLTMLQKIENNDEKLEISNDEAERILSLIEPTTSKSKGKKFIKVLDLIFRFVAMVMALTTLLLCINENVSTKTLVVLLSIGLVCSTMTILPKIEKRLKNSRNYKLTLSAIFCL